MSTGGLFNIIANDGKADRMIMASDLLKMRIKNIMCMKSKQGLDDPSPTLFDIEKTHILYVNAHYKPFAAIGYEYLKVPGNRSSVYGQQTQYSIPQFGDFFYDMVLNVTLAQTQALPGVVPAFPPSIGTTQLSTSSTASVSYSLGGVSGAGGIPANGVVVYTYEYVDIADNVVAVGSTASNFVRYCEYPGERLLKNIRFDVNGNPLDAYGPETAFYHQKFRVAPHKEVGYKRLMGQEVEQLGYSDLLSVAGASNFKAIASNLDNINGLPAAGSVVSSAISSRKRVQVLQGPQTPQAVQPALDMWIPLLFWFNKDVKLSIPSVSIPYGQRFITIDLEQQQNILFTAPGNLFLKLTVESFVTTTGLIGGAVVQPGGVQRYITHTPVLVNNSTIDSTQQISTMDLYINNIFLNPEIHDIYIRRIGFSLIRVNRSNYQRLTNAQDRILLSQLKWPTEFFYAGVRPIYNIDPNNPNQYRDWHRLTLITDNIINCSAYAGVKYGDWNATPGSAAATYAGLFNTSSQISKERLICPQYTETLVDVNIQAHGIDIYKQIKSQFFRDYMAYNYGGLNIVTPEDKGALLINFCLFPGNYQPSGHINISRAREFYFAYNSGYVTSTAQADLIILASAINFLLISDGSAILRYTT